MFKILSVLSYELSMSISSKLLFPVAYSSSETDTCYSTVFKRLLPLFCSEGQPGQQFLVS